MVMTINGVPLTEYRAELLDYKVGVCDYENGYFVPPASMIPVKLTPKIGIRPIQLTIDFMGDSELEAMLRVSHITAKLQKGAQIMLPDGFFYECVFESASAPVEKAPWIWQVKFALSGYRHGSLERHTLTETDSIFVAGTYKTPAVLKITTSESSVKVFGITISNISGEIEIDGIKKTVTQDGVNKFKDTDLVKFPMLEVGYNEIEIEGTATVEVSFYPIYL